MLPVNAVGKKTFGFAGSIVRWFAAAQAWLPGTPVVQASRYTRAASPRCHRSVKNPLFMLLTSKSEPLCCTRRPRSTVRRGVMRQLSWK